LRKYNTVKKWKYGSSNMQMITLILTKIESNKYKIRFRSFGMWASLNDTASHPRKPKSSVTQLAETQISAKYTTCSLVILFDSLQKPIQPQKECTSIPVKS
jgi:hypothetical protein